MTRIPDELALAQPADVPRWSLAQPHWVARAKGAIPRTRVIIDNDFAGDPDDLLQVVHHLLSPSVDTRAIICSHDKEVEGRASAAEALLVARDVFRRMGITDSNLLVQGSNHPLEDASTPKRSATVRAILDEARRDDPCPLFYADGAGLTDLASAYLVDASIAEKSTVVWIGGLQHDDVVGEPVATPPSSTGIWTCLRPRQCSLQGSRSGRCLATCTANASWLSRS